MAARAGNVTVTLRAELGNFTKSLQRAIAQIRAVKNAATGLRSSLNIRSRINITEQLTQANRTATRLQASAGGIRDAFTTAELPARRITGALRDANAAAARLRATMARTGSAVPTGRFAGLRGAIGQATASATAMAQRFAVIGRLNPFRRAETGAKRLRAQTNAANQSFTLLVAKFALVTFAAQTLGNILNSTFGAALRAIDEFEVGVVGAAVGITNIADLSSKAGATFQDAFAQNLNFVRESFVGLDIAAANFLATGTDLQLAFNTLAQRGVIIREDEFDALGAVVDQIKLLTGGQNSSIQIQQELRDLLNGTLRTTSALGKALQARGLDVKALAAEVLRTGDLSAFEGVFPGVLAATEAIRNTLTSVTATFTTLASQVVRAGFADVSSNIVENIRDINDFLIANRNEVRAIANILVNRLVSGFKLIGTLLSEIGGLINAIGIDTIALALVFKLLVTRVGLLPAILLSIATLLVQQLGGWEGVLRVITIIVSLARIGILTTFKAIGGVIDDFVIGINSFKTALERGVLIAIRKVLEAAAALPDFLGGAKAQAALDAVNGLLDQTDDKIKKIIEDVDSGDSNLFNALGGDFEGGFEEFLSQLEGGIAAFDAEASKGSGILEAFSRRFGISADEIKATIERLRTEGAEPFAVTRSNPEEDNKDAKRQNLLLARLLEAQRRFQKAQADAALAAGLNTLNERRSQLDAELEAQKITAQEAFNVRVGLQVQETQLRAANIQAQLNQLADLRSAQEDAIIAQNLPDRDQELQLQLVAFKIETRRVNLSKELARVENQAAQQQLSNQGEIASALREVNRLIQDQANELDNFFVQTTGEKLEQLVQTQERALADLIQRNPALGDEEIQQIETQNRLAQTQLAVQNAVNGVTSAISEAFNSLIDGIVQGSLDFKQVAQNISQTLLKSGLQDFIQGAQEAVADGLQKVFSKFTDATARAAANALAVGLGLLFAILSRAGSDGSFSATGAGAGGGTSLQQVQQRGLVGGPSSLPIAEINTGLQEALIPTNNILAQIEINTRAFAGLNLNLEPGQLAETIQQQLSDAFDQALLQV